MPVVTPRAARLVAAATAATLLVAPRPSRAADTFWSAASAGRWADATRWSTHAVPTVADPVLINAVGTGTPYTVTVDTNGLAAGPLTLDAPAATLALNFLSTFQTGDVLLSRGTLSVSEDYYGPITWTVGAGAAGTLTNNAHLDLYANYGSVPNYATTGIRAATLLNAGTIDLHDVGQFPSAPPYQFVVGNATNTGTIHTLPATYGLQFYESTLNQNAGTIDGVIDLVGSTLNYNGGTVTAASKVTLSLSTLNIAPGAGPASFAFAYSGNTLNGPINPGTFINVLPKPLGADASLTVAAPANDGRILLGYQFATGPITASYKSSLTLAAPAFANNGTLDINTPNSYHSTVNGTVVNNGTVNINRPYDYDATLLNGPWTNNGTITVAASATAQLSPGSAFTQNAGTLSLASAASFHVYNARFDFNGGTVTGAVSLHNSALHLGPGAGSGYFALYADTVPTAMDGDIPAGSTIVLSTAYGAAGAAANKVNCPSFTNAGTLATGLPAIPLMELHLDGDHGTLTNTGTIDGRLGSSPSGTSFRIYGSLTNTGTVRAYASRVTGALNQNAGTLAVTGSLIIVSGSFNYNGGSVTGNPVWLYNSSLRLAAGVPAGAAFQFISATGSLASDVPAGGTVILAPDPTVAHQTVTAAAPFTNAGTITLNPRSTLGATAPFANLGHVAVAADASLVIGYTDASPADDVRDQLLAGRLAPLTPDATHRLGCVDSGSAVTVTLTLAGDANLDGRVNADDYALLDKSFAQHRSNAYWWQGDFNYDGVIDQNDYLLIDTTYGQTHALSPDFLSQRESQFGPAYVSTLLASVPEPSAAAHVIAGLSLVGRRPRRRRE